MQMLGPRSMSSWLRAALGVVSVLLWITLALVGVLAAAYVGALIAIEAGWLGEDVLSARGIKIRVDDVEKNILDWPAISSLFVALFIALPVTILIVRRLKAMLGSFVANDPFRTENGEHLRAIGFAVIVLQFVGAIQYYTALILSLVFQRPVHGEISINLTLSSETLTVWFVIAILFVLAEVFREGARMREDRDLTV